MKKPEPIFAGAALRDVTPQTPHLLQPSGMTRTEPTRGALDPLTVGALALEVGGQAAVILTSDLRRVWPEWDQEIRNRIAQRTGALRERIFVSAVHNHSSSPLAADNSPEAVAALAAAERRILDGFVEAAGQAWDSRRPAEFAAAHTDLKQPVGLNRRMRVSNGTCVNCWHAGAVCPPGHKFVGPGGAHPTRVDVLAVREVGAATPFAVLTSYATHPHLAALPYFSGEVPGGLRRALATVWPEAIVLHTNHTGGDVDMHAAHPEPASRAMDDLIAWYRSSADRFGGRLASAVKEAVDGIRAWPSRATLSHRYWSENEGCRGVEAAVSIVAAMRLGDVALVSIPAEMFVCYGERIHAESPFAETILAGYNGSNNAYLAPASAYEEGSYEVMRGYVPPGTVAPMPCNRRVMPTRDGGEEATARVLAQLAELAAEK